jgi:DNA-binding transcriptional ArsR family regulator
MKTIRPPGAARAAAGASEMRQHADQAAALLKALANPQRLLVLCLLSEGECSVGELHAEIELSQSALSQHLAVLRELGIVATRREGQVIHYRLPAGIATRIIQLLHEEFCGARTRRRSA